VETVVLKCDIQPIYGPDGKVLKSVVVKDATQDAENQTKADLKLKWNHKPPLLGE
jgi:hypothetical protein